MYAAYNAFALRCPEQSEVHFTIENYCEQGVGNEIYWFCETNASELNVQAF